MLKSIDKKFFFMAVGKNDIGKESDVDIAVRCPVCSSDMRWKHTRRLHLYEKNNVTQINCFSGDCSIKNKTVYSFLRDFYPSLLEQYKRENFNNTMQKLAKGETETDVFTQFKKTEKDKKPKIQPVVTHDLTQFIKPIQEVPNAIEYLKKRGFQYDEADYGKWYFGYQDLKIGETLYKITNSIIIPLYYKKEMYGFYSRNIDKKEFYTYNPDANIGYKIFNWFNIDNNKETFICEGIFDALSIGSKNIIALMSAKISNERLKELKKPIFVLDNDSTGIKNSIEYAKRGYSVYIQPDYYKEKDLNELKLNNPNLKLLQMIKENIYSGISAEIRLKSKL